jgi:acetylornithine aminotransferase
MSNTLMSNYGRLAVQFSHGHGVWLWDAHQQRYLDALSGIAVCSLGHCHPKVTAAICEQAQRLVHTSNVYGIERQQALADKLVALSGMENVFFANSGAEANEAAIKIARKVAHQRGIDNPQILVATGSFHGRTMATLSATGNPKVQMGFEPLVQGFIRMPYDNVAALAEQAKNPDVIAVLLEPIQGEGGVRLPAPDYLTQVRVLCDKNHWLMMLDEIQTGIGRTGQWFAYQHQAILPDVLTLAKALGNGVPIGACLARGDAAQILQAGSHGSTFGGNPLACHAALAVLNTIEDEGLISHTQQMGAYFIQRFQQQLAGIAGVIAVRGQGLLLGIELNRPCAPLVQQALAQHLLINVTADKVVRLLPPLIIDEAQANQVIDIVSDLIKNFLANSGE